MKNKKAIQTIQKVREYKEKNKKTEVGIGFCQECLGRLFLDEEFYIVENEFLCKECMENNSNEH